MDTVCLKAGIHGLAPPPIAVAGGCLEVRASHISASSRSGRTSTAISVEKPSVSSPWGFTFRYPLRSLWNGGRKRRDAIAADDVVLAEEKDGEGQNGNWVLKILHVRSLMKQEEEKSEGGDGGGVEESRAELESGNDEEQGKECSDSGEDCDGCRVHDDEEKIEFDRDLFSKMLKKVPLTETRLYAKMCHLGNLAYSIPQIKPVNLLKNHGLRFVTSSIEKREQNSKAEKEKLSAEDQQTKGEEIKEAQNSGTNEVEAEAQSAGTNMMTENKTSGNRISASAAYRIAASAASYLHSHTINILPFKSSKSPHDENSLERISRSRENLDRINEEVASLMATTDSVTAVVAAKEEVKQAVADDLNSTRSSPCEWFVCDDDRSATRYFVIQGSESLASWKANLLFEPIQFEGMDVLVHRGIYEAAKGIYEQMLPDVHAHIKTHGHRATFRFTGHSLGGSLSLLVNLMLLIRGVAPTSSLLPVITFGSPAILCGGDHLLRKLGLPRSHLQAITMHRDIVPRAFSCNYPSHVAEFLKAVNGNFRNLPCLKNQKLLYAPLGEFLILQPDDKFSPNHPLLPSGGGLYLLRCPDPDDTEADKQIRAAQTTFLNSPHPLEILSDRAAYGSDGTIQRDHDMNSYSKSIRNVIRYELIRIRKAKREHRRRVWWPLVAPRGLDAGIITVNGKLKFSGVLQTGKESLRRFGRLVASQHMHLIIVLLFPARMLVLGAFNLVGFR